MIENYTQAMEILYRLRHMAANTVTITIKCKNDEITATGVLGVDKMEFNPRLNRLPIVNFHTYFIPSIKPQEELSEGSPDGRTKV